MTEPLPTATYLEGGAVRVAATLTDFLGNVISPNDVRLLARRPDGVVIQIPSSIAGTERVGVIDLTAPGNWWYRFENTADPRAAFERAFIVQKRMVAAPA